MEINHGSHKRLFVAMPYGKRKEALDYINHDSTVEIDFDAVWTGVLKPAIPEQFDTKRADELRRPGLIDQLYNEWLYNSDIVLADLTFGNPNVYYELGIRQALSRKGTVLVACNGTRLPFDVRNQYVIHYDYFAAPTLREFQSELRSAIENAASQDVDSPVHVFLPGLVVSRYDSYNDPNIETEQLKTRIDELEATLQRHRSREQEQRYFRKIGESHSSTRIISLSKTISKLPAPSIDLLEHLGIRLRQFGQFDKAINVFEQALQQDDLDFEILRELGFAYRKKGKDFYDKAEEYMRKALEVSDSDPELHGMIGGLLKRRSEYPQALQHYLKAHELEPTNLYSLVNLGGMHAALQMLPEAKKWYDVLKQSCEQIINGGEADYWTFLCLAEAAIADRDETLAIDSLRRAKEMGAPIEDLRSATEQFVFLAQNGFEVDVTQRVLSTFDLSKGDNA